MILSCCNLQTREIDVKLYLGKTKVIMQGHLIAVAYTLRTY